jgi:DNA-binding phage protein
MSGYSITLSKRINKASNTVGGALGVIAVRKELSVAYIAEKIGVSRTCIYDWFTGQYDPSPDNLKRLQRLLGK